MTLENTKKLFDAFPNLYRGRNKSPQESAMAKGFDCDDGWFDLIWSLSQKIEDAARREGLSLLSNIWPEVAQVKQKFGTLRFHLIGKQSKVAAAMITDARMQSAHICEQCGKPGETMLGTNKSFGMRTLCAKHRTKHL